MNCFLMVLFTVMSPQSALLSDVSGDCGPPGEKGLPGRRGDPGGPNGDLGDRGDDGLYYVIAMFGFVIYTLIYAHQASQSIFRLIPLTLFCIGMR